MLVSCQSTAGAQRICDGMEFNSAVPVSRLSVLGSLSFSVRVCGFGGLLPVGVVSYAERAECMQKIRAGSLGSGTSQDFPGPQWFVGFRGSPHAHRFVRSPLRCSGQEIRLRLVVSARSVRRCRWACFGSIAPGQGGRVPLGCAIRKARRRTSELLLDRCAGLVAARLIVAMYSGHPNAEREKFGCLPRDVPSFRHWLLPSNFRSCAWPSVPRKTKGRCNLLNRIRNQILHLPFKSVKDRPRESPRNYFRAPVTAHVRGLFQRRFALELEESGSHADPRSSWTSCQQPVH